MHGPFARKRLSGAQIPRPKFGLVKTATSATPATALCPRCQATLTDPDGLGLCPRCGFCRSLEEAAKVPVTEKPTRIEAAAPVVVASWRALWLLPASVWPILMATLFLLPICYLADRNLAPSSTARVLWTVAQVLVGLLLILMAQVWAFQLLRHGDEPLTFLDVVFPAKLWRRTVLALPETGGPLSLCGSGLATILLAIFWIGGWYWWLQGDTTPDLPTTRAGQAQGRDWRDQYQRLKAAAAMSAATGDREMDSAPTSGERAAMPKDPRPTAQCVVIGYIPTEDGSIGGLVLATLRDGKLSYAGTVTKGVDKEQTQGLLRKLASLGSNTPLLGDVSVKAIWVRPELFCEVHQSGYDDRGLLVEPQFKAMIED